MVELKDVNELLVENGLEEANLPFLSTGPARISFMAFQPKGDILPAADSLSVSGAVLAEQMTGFLSLAHTESVDCAICPEYSCPWNSLVASVQAGIFPRQGALWSIGCESITPTQVADRVTQLEATGITVLATTLVPGPGRFINFVCHLFHTVDEAGNGARVALLQAKTTPMGGTNYERDGLICGGRIFRFGRPGENRLVCLICSDVLSTDFRDRIVPELQMNTIVIHLQLNKDSAAAGFSEYRSRCCYIQPRTTEILCLNWAAGTRIRVGSGFQELVSDPKTIYYRTAHEIDGSDNEIIGNHRKGCFLTYWESMRTAAFIFHPDPQVFQFRASKPLMIGAAPAVKRTAPNMEARYEWEAGEWMNATNDADDKFGAYMAANPEAQPHLSPYLDRHVDLERLMQLSTGFALDEDSFDWRQMPSFRLAGDETSARLRLCWSQSGKGADQRSECQRRFRALALAIRDSPSLLPRLSAFNGADLNLTYDSTPIFRKFRNLVVGEKRGTVVFLGMDPPSTTLNDVKDRLSKRLYDHGEDRQILSVLYRDAEGCLKDHMDSTSSPSINDDPGVDPVDILNA